MVLILLLLNGWILGPKCPPRWTDFNPRVIHASYSLACDGLKLPEPPRLQPERIWYTVENA